MLVSTDWKETKIDPFVVVHGEVAPCREGRSIARLEHLLPWIARVGMAAPTDNPMVLARGSRPSRPTAAIARSESSSCGQ